MSVEQILNTAGIVGIAKQSALGTAAAAPLFRLRQLEGGIKNEVETYEQHYSDGQRASAPLQGKSGIVGKGTIKFQATTRSAAFTARGIMGSDTVTGAGPYVHDLVFGNSPSYYTIWEQIGVGALARIVKHVDCRIVKWKLDLLEDTKGALSCEIEVICLRPAVVADSVPAATATGDDTPIRFSDLTGQTVFTGLNGGLALANLKQLYVELEDNAQEWTAGDAIRPVAFLPGRAKAKVAGSMLADSDGLELYNLITYGDATPAADTEPTANLPVVDISCIANVASESLEVVINSVALTTDAELFANPDGGELLVPFAGTSADAASIFNLIAQHPDDSAAY